MRLRALVYGQPAIVAVESCLVSVRGREDRRNQSEVERRYDVLTACQDVVGRFSLNTGLRRSLGSARVLTGDPLATVIADRDVILATASYHVNRRHVVVQRGIRVYGFARRPSGPTIGRFRQLNVVLMVAVILPGRKQMPVCAIDSEPGEVVGANVRSRYALLAPSTEVALWRARNDIVTDLRGCPAAQVRCSERRASG